MANLISVEGKYILFPCFLSKLQESSQWWKIQKNMLIIKKNYEMQKMIPNSLPSTHTRTFTIHCVPLLSRGRLFLYLLNLNLAMQHVLLRINKLWLITRLYLNSLSWGQAWLPSSDENNHPANIDGSLSKSVTLINRFCLSHQA